MGYDESRAAKPQTLADALTGILHAIGEYTGDGTLGDVKIGKYDPGVVKETGARFYWRVMHVTHDVAGNETGRRDAALIPNYRAHATTIADAVGQVLAGAFGEAGADATFTVRQVLEVVDAALGTSTVAERFE